ncbi:MAG: formate dehydrogenase accessory sulfurtransferase FdhD [Actinobacteria bacterium ATB1]|nr:formate dehydrogenase accessory sulfurtransferase FdhD [Actinobacteria bacterium ATB1]
MRPAVRVRAGLPPRSESPDPDAVAVEEPLEIRTRVARGDPQPVAVLMRTPGDDFDLAVGFVLTDGVVRSPGDVAGARYGDPAEFNVVEVVLRHGAHPDTDGLRASLATAACGVCSRKILGEIQRVFAPVRDDPLSIEETLARELPTRLREVQVVFGKTGGVHGAALFAQDGELLLAREDVGRHNAVDKVVGGLVRSGSVPARERILAVSGRAGFEIVQKALMAGIPALVSVSAPSSMAIDLAEEAGMTLLAFTRDDGFNVYSHPHRLA